MNDAIDIAIVAHEDGSILPVVAQPGRGATACWACGPGRCASP